MSVLDQLRACLPHASLVTDVHAVRPFETDGLTAIRERPWAVALPENVDQVRAVLRICREHRVPVVTRGAGTGLSGGARPPQGRRAANAHQDEPHQRSGLGRVYGHRRTRRRQSRHQPGTCANTAVLRARSFLADRLQHRRQRGRELRRRTLFENTASPSTTCSACACRRWRATNWCLAAKAWSSPGWNFAGP